MIVQIFENVNNNTYHYALKLKVDSQHNKGRQDVYIGVLNDISNKLPVQTVIADYKYSYIMDMYQDQKSTSNSDDPKWICNITRFDESLNSIDTIMNEMWKPRTDSYTSYLGEQCIQEASGTYFGFRTLSSDDTFWNIYFNKETKLPEFAISDGPKVAKVIIKKGNYISRTHFEKSEFMPKVCEDSKNIA